MISKNSFYLIIFFVFVSLSSAYPQNRSLSPSVNVISSDRNSILVEYLPGYSDTSLISINSGKDEFYKIGLNSGSVYELYKPGIPAIPFEIINIGVPSEFGNTISILNTSYKELGGRLLPNPKVIKEDEIEKPLYEISSSYYEKKDRELVTFSEFGLIRDLPVQSIVVNPVHFDPASGKIKLYTRIVFRVNFAQPQKISSGYNDKLAEKTIINFDVAKNWAEIKKPELKKVNVINSVLADGKWVRFEAPEEGMYRITRSMLSQFGIDPASVDPRTIKIYNNGGKMLPEDIKLPRPQDLVENAITIVGEEDGRFDEGDYILFYGRGIHFRDYDSSSNSIKRFFNLYSKENYFWITSGGTNGKRISEKPGVNNEPQKIQTSTDAFVDIEDEKINMLKSGRSFFGDDFSSTVRTRTYTNMLQGRLQEFPVSYRIRFINASSETVGFGIAENGNAIFSGSISGYGSELYVHGKEYFVNASFNGSLPENRSVLRFNFTPTTVISTGYIDYVEISYQKSLSAINDYLMFFSDPASGVTEFRLNGFSNTNIKVYDVSDYADVKSVTNPVMHSGSEFRFRMNESSSKISKYIAVGNDNFKTPLNPVVIPNSNLHGIEQGAEYVIITHKNFIEAANRLKTYRESEALIKYPSIVVDVDQIFNEFGGGLKDITAIRDFLKYSYDNWQIKPAYVLFFGGGNYDYKDIEGIHDNFLPPWESTEDLVDVSLSTSSYTSDDYFMRISGDDMKVDMSTGRITVKSAAEANSVVSKIIRYEQDSEIGTWRNLITLVSDDGYTSRENNGSEHTAPNENLAASIIPASFDFKKIYLAAYPIELTSAGRRKPAVNAEIVKSINDGTVIVNYIGHGSPELWAHEAVFEKSITLPQLRNEKYFFLTAATCDFAYFDIPGYQSSAEALLLLENAGSIGAFSSARAVYSLQNHQMMYEFFRNLFNERDTLNLTYPIGYVNFLTKQKFFTINDQKYFIFGDPLLRLNVPQYSAVIDSVNGRSFQPGKISGKDSHKLILEDIPLKALSNARIKGHVVDVNGNVWSDFNGEAILTVFDSERSVRLSEINYNMMQQGGVIFRGRISINSGEFSADFVVPKDISYENKNGKIVVYFYGNEFDGIGYTSNIIIGGTDTTAVNDGKGPEIDIYFDDTSFNESYLINPNSNLIAKLFDETGLNTTGTGVGHKLEGILNDDENDPIDFTNYFTGDLDSGGKSGEINYRFNNIDQGEYKLTLKAWDVFNNYSTETAYFSVVNGDELVIRDIYNYPNPFSTNTTFTFQQNINSPIDVKIKVYTIAGRLIKEIENNNLSEKFVKIDWDGRDQDGNFVANGTYLYKIIVKTADGSFSNSVLGKLAVIK